MSLAVLAAAAVAAAPGAPGMLAEPASAISGVTAYPANFFANIQPTTAMDMIRRLPGFTFDAGANVRGFGGAAGNVLIDGARPASKDDALDQILQRIPAAAVLRIEVIRGGAPGVDMQGKSIIANVIRRVDRGAQVKVSATGTRAYDGRFSGLFGVDATGRAGSVNLEGSFVVARFLDDGSGNGLWTRSDGAGNRIVTAKESSQGHENNYKAAGSAEFPAFGGKLKLNASLLVDPYHSTQDDKLIPRPGSELDQFMQRADTAETGLRYERPFGGKLSLEVYALQQLSRKTTIDNFTGSPEAAALTGDSLSGLFTLRKRTSESIVRASLKYQASPKLSFQAGGEAAYNWMRATTGYIQDNAPVVLPAANVRVAETRGEAFAEATWRPLSTLTVEGGVKVEASRITSAGDVTSRRDLVYPKPRLQATWSPDAANQIRLRVERQVGQLNFDDFTAQTAGINTGTVHTGNPTLNPNQDWVFDAVLEHHFWGSGDLSLDLTHTRRSDAQDRVPVLDPSGTFDEPGNIGTATIDAANLTLTLPTDRAFIPRGLLTGQVTIRRSRVTDPTTGLPRALSGVHGNDWELHFTQGVPRWKGNWGFDINGQFRETAFRYNEIDETRVKIYVSLFSEYKPTTNLTFRMELLNLGGRGVVNSREVYQTLRGSSPLAYLDVRNDHVGRLIKLKIVETFS